MPFCKTPTTKVLDFTEGLAGDWHEAFLIKEDLTPSFTICDAATASYGMYIFYKGQSKGLVSIVHLEEYTQYFITIIGGPSLVVINSTIRFPLQWTRVCVSLDTDSAMIRLVVEGQMLGQEEFKVDEDVNKTATIQIIVTRESGYVSSMNVFSSALSLERMEGMTTAGGEECAAPGDFLSWEEAEWTLGGNNWAGRGAGPTSLTEVEVSEGPCRRESKVQLFNMKKSHDQSDCMEHCQKTGNGRSPTVQTLNQCTLDLALY